MKLISFIFLIPFSAALPQQGKADLNFLIGQWQGAFAGHTLSLDFKNDSTCIWNTDSTGLYPGGLILGYRLDLSAMPYKIIFNNDYNQDPELNYLVGIIEIIDKDKFKFAGEKVVLKNGKVEYPGEEGTIIFSRFSAEK